MSIRYPMPLRPGDVIGVTAPSSGVEPELRPRLDFAVEVLRDRGYDVRLGDCLGAPSHVSACSTWTRSARRSRPGSWASPTSPP